MSSRMSTMTITDFLLARIAEDEDTLPWLVDDIERVGDRLVNLRERILADCEAKRRIVEMYRSHDHSAGAGHHWSGFDGGYATATDHALTALAAVYADHDDYDPGWALS